MSIPKDKPKLIILATDGAPTDEDGRSTRQARQQFIDVLRQRDADMNRIVILLCTDDDAIVKLYEDIDKTIDNICVIDDYQTEKAKVEKCQGDGYNYTQDMHRARFILAGINDIFDKMNERKILYDKYGSFIQFEDLKRHRYVYNHNGQIVYKNKDDEYYLQSEIPEHKKFYDNFGNKIDKKDEHYPTNAKKGWF